MKRNVHFRHEIRARKKIANPKNASEDTNGPTSGLGKKSRARVEILKEKERLRRMRLSLAEYSAEEMNEINEFATETAKIADRIK